MLLCYDCQNGIIDEEEHIIFATVPKLFSISLPKIIQFMKTIDVEIMDIEVKITISKQELEVQSTKKKIVGYRYEPKVTLKDKVYLEMHYSHQPGNAINQGMLQWMKL